MSIIIDDINDDERRLEALAIQMLSAQQTDTASPQELDQINRIRAVKQNSLEKTAHPSFNDGKRLSKISRPAPSAVPMSDATALPELQKILKAAAGLSMGSNSVFSPLNLQAMATSGAPIDPLAIQEVGEEAAEYLKRIQERAELSALPRDFLTDEQIIRLEELGGDISVDQIANTIASVSKEEMVEHALDEAVQTLEKEERGLLPNFPNVALEMLKLGLKMEEFKSGELEEYRKQGKQYQEKIQTFIRFSSLLDKLPSENRTSYDLKEELINGLSGTEKEEMEQCIKEIFPGESYVISKEQLSGGKVRVSDLMGELKTKMTNLLTTEISVVIHGLQMLVQMMQEIAKKHHQLCSTVVSHYGGR